MKVLQVTAVYGTGSVGKIAKVIHENLLLNNYDSFVCVGAKPKTASKNVFTTCSRFLRGFNKLKYYITGSNLSGSNISTRRIIRKIKKIQPDIVHIHCLNDYYLNPHKLFKFLGNKKIKTIITMHCEHYYTGSCGYALECNKWKEGGCHHCYQIKNSSFPLFDQSKKMFKKLNKSFHYFEDKNIMFTPCTPWLMERAKKSIILGDFTNFSPILNGADTSVYKNYNNGFSKNTILYVSPRFSDPVKGSFKINDLAKEFNNQDIDIRVIGDVPQNFKLEPNITYLEKKYGTDLAKEYSAADVTIMLSQAECFPMIIVESLLCGTKVVAFKSGGPENCYDDNFVKFVDQNNFVNMKKEIINFINEKYSKVAVEDYAIRNVSEKVMFNNYLTAYNKILDIK